MNRPLFVYDKEMNLIGFLTADGEWIDYDPSNVTDEQKEWIRIHDQETK